MKHLLRILSVVSFLAVLIGPAVAQQPVAKTLPAVKGPSLAKTMRLLQNELNASGKATFTVITRDEPGGPDQISRYTFEISNVVADSASCTVRYHMKSSIKKQFIGDEDFSLNLHYVLGVRVMTYEQFLKEEDGVDTENPNDQTQGYARFNPPMIMLLPQGEDGFVFADEVLANRIAKTLTRAVELCGGGNKQPF
jgi:hypothetical protein